jgi:hypothetical protein
VKARLQKIIKDERGFGGNFDLLIVIAMIGILAAIIIPKFVSSMQKAYLLKDVDCIKTMIAIAHGADATERTCPVSELAYEALETDGKISVSCPDPDNHLRSSPQVIGSYDGLIVNLTVSEFNPEQIANLDSADGFTLVDRQDAVALTEKMGWGGTILIGVIMLGLAVTLCGGISQVMMYKNPGEGLTIVVGFAIFFLIVGLIFHPLIKTTEYRFLKSSRLVSIHNFYAGHKLFKPEIINDVIAAVPLRVGKKRMNLSIFYGTTEDIQYQRLFKIDREKLAMASVLNQALIDGELSIITAVEPPSETIETAEETEASEKKKPGFFETLKSLSPKHRSRQYRHYQK